MTQRTLAGLLAVPLLVALWLLALREPLPFVTYSPGLTLDVLGAVDDGGEIIEIDGAKTYDDDGELRMTTVLATPPQSDVNLFEALGAWIDPDSAVYPYDAIYGPEDTDESQEQEGDVQMASSQDAAIAAALTELDMDFEETPVVQQVLEGSPADGVLQAGDLLESVGGVPVTTTADAAEAVDATPEDEPVEIVLRRDGERETVSIERELIDGEPRIGITMRPSFEFPIDVTFNVNPEIGGPSAGLMFSLAIYDTLTEGSMTDGEVVAGTGTIDEEGSVGPIGGIDQKIAGARQDDAELFLVPAGNCDDAVDSPQGDMELVRVGTLAEAVDAIETWTEDPEADLPRCTDETGDARE